MALIDVIGLKVQKVRQIDAPFEFCYGAEQAIPLLCRDIGCFNVEHAAVICMSESYKIVGYSVVSMGGASGTSLDIQQIIRICLLTNAQKIILGHNHPTGGLRLSDSDIEATRSLAAACRIFNIQLVDSIVVNADGGCSMRENLNGKNKS